MKRHHRILLALATVTCGLGKTSCDAIAGESKQNCRTKADAKVQRTATYGK
jgi:hypothetical protein